MAPWLSVAPGGAIFMITLSFNFVSDALDRRLRL
jgi:ABC-type dipeptide/oligopeptide/nickel transport system permease subunit